jgi:hypothetical protein
MKFGHPRLYNPWASGELQDLEALINEVGSQMNHHINMLDKLQDEHMVLNAQIRDCYLTTAEQAARLDALDEMGAPQ